MPRPRWLEPTQVPHSAEVLLLVDVINPLQFPNAGPLLQEAVRAARRIVRLKARLREKGVATIYANDN